MNCTQVINIFLFPSFHSHLLYSSCKVLFTGGIHQPSLAKRTPTGLRAAVPGLRSFQANWANPSTLDGDIIMGEWESFTHPSFLWSGANLLRGSWEDFSFLIKGELLFWPCPDSFHGLVFTLRGPHLRWLDSQMHPKGTTDTQKLAVNRMKIFCEDVTVAPTAAILQSWGSIKRTADTLMWRPNTVGPASKQVFIKYDTYM